jgi:hypothetical protein
MVMVIFTSFTNAYMGPGVHGQFLGYLFLHA